MSVGPSASGALAGTRIRARRLDAGVAQGELARRIGVSPSYLNLIEHNRRRIGGKLLNAIARALDLEPALLSEGAGGALVPVTRELLYADLFARWAAPTVIVARTGLGTINHSLLTIEALRGRGVPILGVAFVGPAHEDSEATICAIGQVRHLGRLPFLDSLDAESLAAAFERGFAIGDFA